ncbi:hypothetical protein MYX84_11425 [Acidobacteria bacterium AH-259-O06]|nr:hypothetical protein [Acidobacteria bacterium AH-259-O06]
MMIAFGILTSIVVQGYYSHMRRAKVSDLKNQLSRYLDYVRQGETILVFDRKIPVAELHPVSQKAPSGKLAALERKGIIRRGRAHLPKKFFKETLGGKRAGVLRALLEEREQGR